jgi:phenylalanyl-tRNA synthetase beta chain
MPVVSFALKCLNELTDSTPEQLEKLAFDYGLEAEIDGDHLNVEVTAERPDLLAVEGFTRAMNVFTSGKSRSVPNQLQNSGLVITVRKEVQSLRPYIGALVVENLRLNSVDLGEIIQFQEKVCQTFGRQRKKLAIGIYDLSKVNGNIEYGAEDKNIISFVPLKGDKELTGHEIITQHPTGIKYASALPDGIYVPILRDDSGQVLSMPPIINSQEIGNITPKVSSLFVDVTGLSMQSVNEMLSILAHNFLDFGAQVKTVTIRYPDNTIITPNLRSNEITYSLDNLNKIVGVDISEKDLSEYLGKMDLLVTKNNTVLIPSYRTDMLGEVDIAGDLLVAIGLHNLEPNVSTIEKKEGKSNSLKDFSFRIGDLAKKMGLVEVKSLILTDPDWLSLFSSNYVQTENAKSRTFSSARISLQPGMIEILAQNITAPKPVNIYEIGEILHVEKDGSIYETISWGFSSLDSQASFSRAKSYIQTILKALGLNYELAECSEKRYILGRAAYILINGIEAGHFGEIHPKILDRFSFPEPICSGEVDCQILMKR